MSLEKIQLKGGSLSGTFLCQDGDETFIRKQVSLRYNHEYGFQRWYSQLKRLQRYNRIHPSLFPKVLRAGRDNYDAYFDLEYFPDSVTLFDYITNGSYVDIENTFERLMVAMNSLHSTSLSSSKDLVNIYAYDQVLYPITCCILKETALRPCISTIILNGITVPGFCAVLPSFNRLLSDYYTALNNWSETFSHGNLTLENILIQPDTGRIMFIDPYEENVIDSKICDYSQILQSSNSRYELLNSLTPSVNGNRVDIDIPFNTGLSQFNDLFMNHLKSTYKNITIIRLFEISQFIRMLPFKMAIDQDKMVLFYAWASVLFQNLREEIGDV